MSEKNELDLPGNSSKAKDYASRKKERTEPTAVAKGKKQDKKPGAVKRFGKALFGDLSDAPKMDITEDVIIPAVKNTVLDTVSAVTGTVTNAFEIALFGEVRRRGRGNRRETRNGYIDYSASSRGSEDRRGRSLSRRDREMFDFSNITYETRDDAMDVLERLRDLIDDYDEARVSDFYSLSGITPSYQDRKWGWDDLSRAYPERDGPEYILVLPKPVYLK